MKDAPKSRRGLLLSVLGLALSGILLLLAARLQPHEAPGASAANASLLQTMGWLLLAAIAALFATTGWVRRIVGVVICGAGVAAAADLARAIANDDQGWVLWIPAGLIASGLALTTGVVVVARGGRWPGWSRRFDPASESRPTDPLDQWRALDRGEDPTR